MTVSKIKTKAKPKKSCVYFGQSFENGSMGTMCERSNSIHELLLNARGIASIVLL